MKKSSPLALAGLTCLMLMSGCEDRLLQERYDASPIGCFEVFCDDFDLFYGAFEAKGISWDSLRMVYGAALDKESDEKELFDAMCGMLNALNDGHADIWSPEYGYYRSWNRRNKSYFSDLATKDKTKIAHQRSVIMAKYLDSSYQFLDISGQLFFYGTITTPAGCIGYLCIPTFNLDLYPVDFIQEALDAFQQADAVIIDLRFNGGGRTEAFVHSLNCFAGEERCYMQSKFRNGPGHTDFTVPEKHRIHPHPDALKPVPVAVLMNSYSASSSDHFILGMKSQPNVITVGDTTCGAFSSVVEKVLPNGWKYRLGSQVALNPDGTLLCDADGRYLEGTGIAPDYYAPDKWYPLTQGVDEPLQKALEELRKRL